MKTIECLTQVILKDGDASATNHPGSVLALPDDEADALIAEGRAKIYIDPAAAAEIETPPPLPETVSAGPRFDETN